MNTALTTVYHDVDSAAINWSDITEGAASWDDLNILKLCKDAKTVLHSDESDAFKVGYAKAIIYCIKEAITAKTSA